MPNAHAIPRRSAASAGHAGCWWPAYSVICLYLTWLFDFGRVFTSLPKVWVIVRLMLDWSSIAEWDHAELWRSMLETVAMAYLGTILAMVFAVPLGFLGARNIIPQRVFRFCTRRLFDGLRGLDQLIWALVFVRAMGLGPIAGIMAIAVAETGVLAKLFAEAVENIDRNQVDGIISVGAGFAGRLRFAVLPQVEPVMISQALYSIESEFPRGDDLGPGRRRRHWAAAGGADSDQCLGSGGIYHRSDPDLRCHDRHDITLSAATTDRRGARLSGPIPRKHPVPSGNSVQKRTDKSGLNRTHYPF